MKIIKGYKMFDNTTTIYSKNNFISESFENTTDPKNCSDIINLKILLEFNQNNQYESIINKGFNVNSIINRTNKRTNEAISDGLKRYKNLNGYEYENLEKCEDFLNVISRLSELSSPIISFGEDEVKADIRYFGNKFTLKCDFDCPSILFFAYFARNNQGKKVLYVNECNIKNYIAIKDIIFNSNAKYK